MLSMLINMRLSTIPIIAKFAKGFNEFLKSLRKRAWRLRRCPKRQVLASNKRSSVPNKLLLISLKVCGFTLLFDGFDISAKSF